MAPERFEKLRKHAEKQDYGKPLAALTLAGYLKECLDEIERLQAERRWIPVTERLPETNEPVWVSNPDWPDPSGTRARWINGQWRTAHGYWDRRFAPTHWKPLPDGPEKGEG